MLTSQFIQFASKRNLVFNVAHIAYVERRTVTIKDDAHRATYDGYPLDGDKAYSIFVYETFARVTSALSPYVIIPPEPDEAQNAEHKARA